MRPKHVAKVESKKVMHMSRFSYETRIAHKEAIAKNLGVSVEEIERLLPKLAPRQKP
jgi:hypothetical protein